MFFALLISAVCLYFVYRGIKNWGRANASLAVLGQAQPLASAEVGALVKFTAQPQYPEKKTPFSDRAASFYWAQLRGVFTRKRKKPGKGTVTHRPILHSESSLDEPLMLQTGDQTSVLLSFDEPRQCFIDLETTKDFEQSIPAKYKQKDNPKYERYELEEFYYPVGQALFVVGEIKAKNRACVTIGEWSDAPEECVVSSNSEKAVFAKKRSNRTGAIFTFLFSSMVLALTWVIYASPD